VALDWLGLYKALALLGDTTLDVHLNDVVYWANVPEEV
jgi:hypothetical protein